MILGLGLEIGDLEVARRTEDREREDKSLREAILLGLQVDNERVKKRLGFVKPGANAICTATEPQNGNILFSFFPFFSFFIFSYDFIFHFDLFGISVRMGGGGYKVVAKHSLCFTLFSLFLFYFIYFLITLFNLI